MQNSLSKRLSVLKPSSLILSLVLALTACSSTLNTATPTTVPAQSSTNNNSQMLENTLTQCPTSHSESTMCTMQYDPVCVKTKVGSVISYRTAGNACSACNIPEAIGYTKGECS